MVSCRAGSLPARPFHIVKPSNQLSEMNVKTFNEILDRHIRTTLIPQLKNNLNRFAIGALLGSGALRAESMKSQLELMGIMHDDDIDTVKLASALTEGFRQAPEVSFYGFRFNKDDADALLREFNVAEPPKEQPPEPEKPNPA